MTEVQAPAAIPDNQISHNTEGDNDSGVDESTQGNDHVNGSPGSPGKKSPSKIPGLKGPSGGSAGPGGRTVARSPNKNTPNTPDSTTSNTSIEKKIGAAPSPNIRTAKSKIGSLDNTTHKPGGGKVKIENRKLDFNNVTPRIAAKNETYQPGGGDKKITQKKLQWNAKSKIGSLENATHKPGGGDKKIESIKLDFKDKAKPKVASTVNITHKPGGGDVKECYDYLSLQDLGYRRESSGPRSIMSAGLTTSRKPSDRPQRPRTARDPPARSRYLSPRKCQTSRVDCTLERPPFRIY